MSFKINVNLPIGKKLNQMSLEDKRCFVNSINLMGSIGQIGEPLIRQLDVWRYRSGDIRIIYAIKDFEILILDVLLGLQTENETSK